MKQRRLPNPSTGAGPSGSPPRDPPTASQIAALCGTNYATAYRWTRALSRFPLDAYIKVITALDADLPTALAWAAHWLRGAAPDAGPDAPAPDLGGPPLDDDDGEY